MHFEQRFSIMCDCKLQMLLTSNKDIIEQASKYGKRNGAGYLREAFQEYTNGRS